MGASAAAELESFLSDLASKRSRLSELLRTGSEDAARRVADEVSDLGEELLVAEEELRAQAEELAVSQSDLESLASRYQQMFVEAADAYVLTDTAGIVVDRNRAADRLLSSSGASRLRSLASSFELADRPRLRSLIRDAQDETSAHRARLLLHQEHGGPIQVEATVETFDDEIVRARRLRWRLVPVFERAQLHAVPEPERTPADSNSVAAGAAVGAALEKVLLLTHTELAAGQAEERDPEQAVAHVARLARRFVPGTAHVGVSILDGLRIRTLFASEAVVEMCDTVQSDLGEGPSLEPVELGEMLHVPDLDAEARWPRFGVAARQFGIASMLACHVPAVGRTHGCLTLYAGEAGAFTEEAQLLVPVLADKMSIALHNADRARNLRRAVQSRQVIGQATGILMEHFKISADAAFGRLVAASQHSHVKVRELAQRVAETGEDPQDLVQ